MSKEKIYYKETLFNYDIRKYQQLAWMKAVKKDDKWTNNYLSNLEKESNGIKELAKIYPDLYEDPKNGIFQSASLTEELSDEVIFRKNQYDFILDLQKKHKIDNEEYIVRNRITLCSTIYNTGYCVFNTHANIDFFFENKKNIIALLKWIRKSSVKITEYVNIPDKFKKYLLIE